MKIDSGGQAEQAAGALPTHQGARMPRLIEGEAEVVPSLPAPGSGGTKMPKA